MLKAGREGMLAVRSGNLIGNCLHEVSIVGNPWLVWDC
jgi:hypothetical protein